MTRFAVDIDYFESDEKNDIETLARVSYINDIFFHVEWCGISGGW